jgi:hypothetical protein
MDRMDRMKKRKKAAVQSDELKKEHSTLNLLLIHHFAFYLLPFLHPVHPC